MECTEEEAELLATVSLLTNKLVIYAANMSDADFKGGVENNPYFAVVEKLARQENAGVLPICAEVEAEISGMEPEEKQMFLEDMGLSESGLDRLIRECYTLLGLISYLTAGPQEVRAWTIKEGTKAPQAAGVIHNDLMNTFILAQVTKYQDLVELGDETAVKANGKLMQKGKEYVVEDGDIIYFRSGAGKN